MSDADEAASLGTAEEEATSQLILAICNCGEALVRKKQKNRSRRKPIDAEVDAELKLLLDTDWAEILFLEFMEVIREHIDKPFADWTSADYLRAMDGAIAFFLNMAKLVDPPRGRPVRPRESHLGLVFDQMFPAIDSETVDLPALVESYLRVEKPYKVGMLAGKEIGLLNKGGSDDHIRNRLTSYGAFVEYLRDPDDDEEPIYLEGRMSKGGQSDLFRLIGGKPENLNAFRVQLSRAKKKLRSA